jgi:hypothetical protein
MPHQQNKHYDKEQYGAFDPKQKFSKAFEKNIIAPKSNVVRKGKSSIAQIGILHILNQMKNPLTNIMLCLEMIENNEQDIDNEGKDCHEIIKTSSKALESSIRDLIKSFNDLGISVQLGEDRSVI